MDGDGGYGRAGGEIGGVVMRVDLFSVCEEVLLVMVMYLLSK